MAPSVANSMTTNRSGVNASTGLPNGFNAAAYGTPPHLRKGPASVVSTSSSKFAKVKAAPKKLEMDAARIEREREEKDNDELDSVAVQESDSDSE